MVAQSSHRHWWIWASLWGAILIAVGFHFFSSFGALSGLLIGYFNGWRIEHQGLQERASAIADAERERAEAEKTWHEVRNEQQLFSQREARTGEPDRDNWLGCRIQQV